MECLSSGWNCCSTRVIAEDKGDKNICVYGASILVRDEGEHESAEDRHWVNGTNMKTLEMTEVVIFKIT